MPNLAFSWVITWASSAFFSSALDGMHPTLRQTRPVLLLDDRRAQPQLRAADRGDIAAGTCTEDNNVVVSHGPSLEVCRLPPSSPGASGMPFGRSVASLRAA